MIKKKVLYVAGPGNVIATYKCWRQGEQNPAEASITYSSQFFQTIERLGMSGYVLTTHNDESYLEDGDFILEHRPNKANKNKGLKFHLGQLKYGFGILKTALKYKADYVVIATGTHWFMLWPLVWFGIKVIPTVHCVLWPKYGQRKWIIKVIDFFNGLFLRHGTDDVMVVSQEISIQLKKLKIQEERIQQFSPLYSRQWFESILDPNHDERPFKLLYIGRIERVKGVFDLLTAFNTLCDSGLDIELDYCGNGSDLEALKSLTFKNSKIRCHGHCNRDKVLSLLSHSHTVVVPTTTQFIEGFNKVVIESVLANRPVVTSDVCPAVIDVLPSVVLCEPDNVISYTENIRKLYQDKQYYKSKQEQCSRLHHKFFEKENSWGHLLYTLLEPRNEN